MRILIFFAVIFSLTSSHALAQTTPETMFYEDSCGVLFQTGEQPYRRPAEEMPNFAMFILGYYGAAANEAPSLNEIANRNDVIPGLIQHCLNNPDKHLLQALADTIPAPMELPVEGTVTLRFAGPCDDIFGVEPTFKGSASEFSMLAHFSLGYYTAKGTGWNLQPSDLDDRRDLIPMLYARCMEAPDTLLTRALDETIPGAPQ